MNVAVRHVIVALCLVVAAVVSLDANVARAEARPQPLHLHRISRDPFSNPQSQHATEVEPDTFAHGRTVVAAFQTGRYFNGGSSDIGFSVSLDGGHTWKIRGFLPHLTALSLPPGPYARASDPAVAYDDAHHTWLISSLGIGASDDLAVSRSTDDGRHWSVPSIIPARTGQDFDKNWIVCDNGGASPFLGRCYSTWDDFGHANLLLSSTSTDGGATWSTPKATDDNARGIGGQPLVQPNGTVIVPSDNLNEDHVIAYRSTDGGATWRASVPVASIQQHFGPGGLRTDALPSAEIDDGGTVYVAWQDCRFRAACSANDIVLSRSSDGVHWTGPARVPIDEVTSTADHFIPGLAVDRHAKGEHTRLALSYYFYPQANCTRATCRLEVGFISSGDAGSTWSRPKILSSVPMPLSWLPATTLGVMVGDYISTSFVGPRAVSVFALAAAPTTTFHEAMFASVHWVGAGHGPAVSTVRGARPAPVRAPTTRPAPIRR